MIKKVKMYLLKKKKNVLKKGHGYVCSCYHKEQPCQIFVFHSPSITTLLQSGRKSLKKRTCFGSCWNLLVSLLQSQRSSVRCSECSKYFFVYCFFHHLSGYHRHGRVVWFTLEYFYEDFIYYIESQRDAYYNMTTVSTLIPTVIKQIPRFGSSHLLVRHITHYRLAQQYNAPIRTITKASLTKEVSYTRRTLATATPITHARRS